MPRRGFGPPVAVEHITPQKGPRLQHVPKTAVSLGSLEGELKVPVGDALVKVMVDPDKGPLVKSLDGSYRTLDHLPVKSDGEFRHESWTLPPKKWVDMSSTEQEVFVHFAAKTNLARVGAMTTTEMEKDTAVDLQKEESEETEREKRASRCRMEMDKKPLLWMPVGLDVVMQRHESRAPGMIYGLQFPWKEALLEEFGPSWLTSAFHAAGTLERDNLVTTIKVEKKIKVTGGNNGGKFLFEVRYKHARPGLHTKLFAKVPFPCTGATKSDRLSSSVYKQPMDLIEINTYRLLEAKFPMPTPKYYYGDISNETTNFILITERVPFAEVGGKWKKGPLQPYEIEGPYDKCKDFQFRSPATEYYSLLFKVSGELAGWYKSGKLAPQAVLDANLGKPRGRPDQLESWGMRVDAATGDIPQHLSKKLDAALEFMKIAQVVFPAYVTDENFCKKFKQTIMTASAYKSEIEYWKHSDWNYVSLAHTNLNSDNAYFWRDEDDQLQCGVFDWGGLSTSSLGHKLWWCINCADYENTSLHVDSWVDTFITAYRENGGPELEPEKLKMQMFLTALDNVQFMVAAVPNCHTMCPLKEWETIRDKHDPRIAENIDGKSTLRTTLHVLNHGVRWIQEGGIDQVLAQWIDRWAEMGAPRKSEEIIGLA